MEPGAIVPVAVTKVDLLSITGIIKRLSLLVLIVFLALGSQFVVWHPDSRASSVAWGARQVRRVRGQQGGHQIPHQQMNCLRTVRPSQTRLKGFFPGGQMVKHLPTIQETWVRSLAWEDPLEKEMATQSSTLAWKIPRTE